MPHDLSFLIGKQTESVFQHMSASGSYWVRSIAENKFEVVFENRQTKYTTEPYDDFVEAVGAALFLIKQDNDLSEVRDNHRRCRIRISKGD